jgi:phage portal protein BeeE
MVDRLLNRASFDNYSELVYSGAYQLPSADQSGRGKEGALAGVVRAAREAYAANGIVFACVAARMALFSEARFQWQSQVDRHLFGTTDLRLLEYPWPNATAGELLARLELGASTAGNAYIRRADPADGSDALLVEMRPDCVTIISEEARDTQGRTFRRPIGYAEDLRPQGVYDRPPQFFSVREVAHYSPAPDGTASFKGTSWLAPVLTEIGADEAMTTYKTEHLRSGAQLGIVVKYSQKLQPATIDSLRERIQARYGGPVNAGKTLVLDQGGDAVVAGSTLAQLQFTAVQQATETRIAAASSVPVEIIGIEGPRSASGNYELAIRRFADLWARPHWRMACATLQHLLTFTNPLTGDTGPVQPPFRLWYDVSDIAALREGELARGQTTLVKMQAVAAAVTAGYSRDSAVAAADSGDLRQLKADPAAAPPGAPTGVRAPQAGVPEDLPGAVKPNVPNARPLAFQPVPSLPNGARGNESGGTRG